MDDICALIEKRLREGLKGADIQVEDPMQDQTHLQATVTYAKFSKMSLIEQHRLVMNLLKKDFSEHLHALSLKTKSK